MQTYTKTRLTAGAGLMTCNFTHNSDCKFCCGSLPPTPTTHTTKSRLLHSAYAFILISTCMCACEYVICLHIIYIYIYYTYTNNVHNEVAMAQSGVRVNVHRYNIYVYSYACTRICDVYILFHCSELKIHT